MRPITRITAALAATVPLWLALPALAQDDDETGGEEGEGGAASPAPAPTPEPPKPDPEAPKEDDEPAEKPDEKVDAANAGQKPGAAAAEVKGEEKDEYPKVELSGYGRGAFSFLFRGDARPKDRIDYGFDGLGGLTIEGAVHRMWRAEITVEVETGVRTVRDVTLQPDGLEIESDDTGLSVQEATAQFLPHETITIKGGVTRIPFTLQQQSPNTELMFPNRSSANQQFFTGSDVGGLVEGDFFDGILVSSVGVFNGDSITDNFPRDESRGVAIAARVDVQPFGEFPFGEGDLRRGDYRLGVGFGIMVQPATLYDEATGTEPRKIVDLRISASLRMAVKGVYFATEYFRRQQEDDFSFRPEVADGAYGQVGVLIPFTENVGLEPILRLGFVAEDQTFDPRLIGNVDGGVNFYPLLTAKEPDAVKVSLLYLGERRFTENEEAHGAATSLQIEF